MQIFRNPESRYTYSFFWIQEDICIEELVTVIILSFPLLHKLVQVWSITYEACGNKYEEVSTQMTRKWKYSCIHVLSLSHMKSHYPLCCCRLINFQFALPLLPQVKQEEKAESKLCVSPPDPRKRFPSRT